MITTCISIAPFIQKDPKALPDWLFCKYGESNHFVSYCNAVTQQIFNSTYHRNIRWLGKWWVMISVPTWLGIAHILFLLLRLLQPLSWPAQLSHPSFIASLLDGKAHWGSFSICLVRWVPTWLAYRCYHDGNIIVILYRGIRQVRKRNSLWKQENCFLCF